MKYIISLKLGTQTESAGVMSYARHIFFNQYRHSVNALTFLKYKWFICINDCINKTSSHNTN